MTAGLAVAVHVNPGTFARAPVAALERAVLTTLAEEGVRSAEVSVTLLGDDAIRELNRSYLGKDRPTDVISFSLGDGGHPLGDIYIGVPEARRQASDLRVPLEEELVRLAIHGTLHVLGYDHPAGPERNGSPMYLRQEHLVGLTLGQTPTTPTRSD